MEKVNAQQLIEMINSLVQKNRDMLSEDEILVVEKTKAVFNRLEDSEVADVKKDAELIAVNLLRFFIKPETIKLLLEWLNQWFNN